MKRQLLHGVIGIGGLRLFALATQMLAAVLVARQLGPEHYGQLAFTLAVVNLAWLPGSGGLYPLVAREVARGQAQDNLRGVRAVLQAADRWAWRVGGGTALLVAVLTMFATIDDRFRTTLLVPASLFIPFWALVAVRSAGLQGLGRVVVAQMADWLWIPGTYLVLVGMLSLTSGLGPMQAILASLAATLCGLLYASVRLRQALPLEIEPVAAVTGKIWFGMLLPFNLLQTASLANVHVVTALLGLLGDARQVGLYRVADNLAALTSLSLLIVNAAIAPYIVRLHTAGEQRRLQRLVRGSARLAFIVATPVIALLVFAGHWIIELLFGAAYLEAYPAALVLLAGHIVNLACGSVGLLLNMSGHEKDSLHALFGSIALNVLLCLVLIPGLGEIGAATASAIAMVFWNLLLVRRVISRLGIHSAIV